MPTLRDAGAAADLVRASLARVQRRLQLGHTLRSTAFGVGAVAIVLAVTIPTRIGFAARTTMAVGIGAVVAGLAHMRLRRERTPGAAAAALERGYPSLRNLAVTAAELIADPERTRPYMWRRVMQTAARALTGADARRVVPLGREAVALTV